MDSNFFIQPDELNLRFSHGAAKRQLAFHNWRGNPQAWRSACLARLTGFLGLDLPVLPGNVRLLRQVEDKNVTIQALVMHVEDTLSIPAYLLIPSFLKHPGQAILAIHGHGSVEPCLGYWDDYHHAFALALAQAGHIVLCPELRGFGALVDLSRQTDGSRLDYWNWGEHMAYSLVTDGFLYGKTLIGETTADLLRWEAWLAENHKIAALDAVGISYGGDLALLYPIYSSRVKRIFASGSLGSFKVIFEQCYNAPAHCIPGILEWMDRSDIAGLNAPRPILLQYGELDVPGPENHSASYNATVPTSLEELRSIYRAFGAENRIQLTVSPGKGHEMDIPLVIKYLTESTVDSDGHPK